MNKFKVGDKYKVLNGCGCLGDYIGKVGIVCEINNNDPDWCKLIFNGDRVSVRINTTIDKLELVSECEPCSTGYSSTNIGVDFGLKNADMVWYDHYAGEFIKNNKQTIMSKITTFAKNLVLSSDEKLLRKYGLKNECGEFTSEANELVIAKLVKENETYLVELVKKMDEEEKNK